MFSSPQNVLSQIHIDPGMTVADFGCGSGHYTLLLAEQVGPSGSIFAFDIQKELLARLKNVSIQQNFENIHFNWADLDEPNSTSLKESSLDRVFMTNILFQAEDKKALIREAKRVLKTTGKVILVDWSESFAGLGPREADVVSKEVAERIFSEEGFIKEKDLDAGEHHYGLVFKLN